MSLLSNLSHRSTSRRVEEPCNIQRKPWYAKAPGFYLAATYVVMSSLSFSFNILVLGDTSLYILLDVSAQIMLKINGQTNGQTNDPPLIAFYDG
jgi:hypothetical protein